MINKQQIDLFEEYSKIRKAIAMLTERQHSVSDQILETIDKTETSSYGVFTPVTKTTIKYSHSVNQLETEAKRDIRKFTNGRLTDVSRMKSLEELNGTAKRIPKTTLRYVGHKENK